MKHHSNYDNRAPRHGLSIMEVLFAIAVLTIGMLGVASILPVATNNAATAIQSDRAVEEINNRIATDLSRLSGSLTELIVAENSQLDFNNPIVPPAARFDQRSVTSFGAHIAAYESRTDFALDLYPNLPDAFCIDPWFLSAASNLRNDTTDANAAMANRNGYDRTLFPCFDPRYHPINASPSEPMNVSTASLIEGPRFTRVALPFEGSNGWLSASGSEALMRQSDDFSVVVPDDRTRRPGLFIQRSTNGASSLTKNSVSSRYSSIVMMSRNEQGSNLFNAAIVTMLDRHIVTVPGGSYDGSAGVPAFNLAPYTATDPSITNVPPPADNELLFPGEQLGYVTQADQPFVGGGGGEFEFRTSRFVLPDIDDGDWIMLMRRDYVRDRNPTTGTTPIPQIQPGRLRFAWYRVTEIINEPQLVTVAGVTSYQTRISVRGPDWKFHPIQTVLAPGVYSPPYFGNVAQPTWGNPPGFDYDVMPARGNDPGTLTTPPFSPLYEHQDYGTFVVIVPSAISVRQLQVEL